MISARKAGTIRASSSLPRWGSASMRISRGAPHRTSVSSIRRTRGRSLLRLVSLPSENSPAPPSPYSTLLSPSSSPAFQNRPTCPARRSTGWPRSISNGRCPASANARAAISPAGPAPTTTTRPASAGRATTADASDDVSPLGCGSPDASSRISTLPCIGRGDLLSTSASTLSTNTGSPRRLRASTERRTTATSESEAAGRRSIFAAAATTSRSS